MDAVAAVSLKTDKNGIAHRMIRQTEKSRYVTAVTTAENHFFNGSPWTAFPVERFPWNFCRTVAQIHPKQFQKFFSDQLTVLFSFMEMTAEAQRGGVFFRAATDDKATVTEKVDPYFQT